MLLVMGVAFWISAGTLRPVGVEDLAARAQSIVHGSVASLETRQEPGGGTRTTVEFEVRDVWKGVATNRFTLALAGGVLGNRRVVLVGQPEFRIGDEAVVFTVNNERGEGVLLELGQGRFAVRRDNSGNAWVGNGIFGDAAADGVATRASSYRPPNRLPMSLGELKRRVQASNVGGAK